MYRELKSSPKLPPKITDPMKKWTNELSRVFQREKSKWPKKNHEEMLTIPGHNGNANQNHVEILPHSC
jgi:hypothetical protein